MGNKNDARKRRKGGPVKFKRRSYHGNRFVSSTSNDSVNNEEENNVYIPASSETVHASSESASSRKLKTVVVTDTPETETTDTNVFHYLIIDSEILQGLINVVGKCPNCEQKDLVIVNKVSQKKGLANFIQINCNSCEFVYNTYTSKHINRQQVPGQNPFDINARAVVAFREIGKGHSAIDTLFGLMNFIPVMHKDSFSAMNKDVAVSYSKVARSSMLEAANELHSDDENLCNIGISCDGTWQKRGFSSLLGAVTVISVDTGKCLDYKVLSKKCAMCTKWESRKGTDAYEKFENVIRNSHECSVNHDGSAGSMEVKGIMECFATSIEKYNLRYTEYLGDGDSKGYKEVCESDPYNGIPISKLECIGHIQKRVGRKLRNLREDGAFKELYEDSDDDDDDNNGKKKKKKNNKKIRLTDKIINKLQNYYGIAVRATTGRTVEEMKKDIGAALYHCVQFDSEDQRHIFCPKTAMSWCKYQADIINDTHTYKSKVGIHRKIFSLVKPVFMELSDDALLKKCLHGQTQNNNESLNGLIWKKCPKDVYVGRTTLEMGVDSAVINFNAGSSRIIDVMKEYGIQDGYYTNVFCCKKDEERIKECNRKHGEKGKASRKRHRAIRKGFGDKEKEKEGVVYGAGMCDT